jgi:two-component system, LuxR family, response regulator FixJ
VIVVDDDLSIRRSLRTLLSSAGFNVCLFDSAEALLASKFPLTNACLLLDIYLPGMTGPELCDILAASGRLMPTVLMTGRDDEMTKKLARKAKSFQCLVKPFDHSALLRAISKAIQNR